jgi:hypothetical protein
MSQNSLDSIQSRFAGLENQRKAVWDALWARQSVGRIATAVAPGEKAVARAREACAGLSLREPERLPARWTPKWREHLLKDVGYICAQMEMLGDGFMGLSIDRGFYGQSQGMAEIFGARVDAQADGNYYVHPLTPDPAAMAALKPRPLEESLYWAAVDYVRYARHATEGVLPVRAPVMTGALDTANYLLGSTVVLEWVYSEPEALKALLAAITDVIVRLLQALQAAAGGRIDPQLVWCMRGGPDICSELRAIISADIYEEFEAPCLREIARRTGPLAVHSCGSWERTVPSACDDPGIRAMNGGSQESDAAELCRLANGRMTLSVYRSQNCHERCLWPENETFWSHILQVVPPAQPFELTIPEKEIPLWNRLCNRYGRPENCLEQGME